MVKHATSLPKITPLPLPPDDVKWSSVSLLEVLERGTRFVASVYDIEGKHAREILAKCRWEIVSLWSDEGFVTSAYYPTRFKRIYIKQSNPDAVGFLGSAEMLDVKPKPKKFLSHRQNDIDVVKVREGNILLSRSGTIGKLTYVSRTLRDYLVSEHSIRISCREYAGYVYAYLKTKTGQTLITTNIHGAVVDQIEPDILQGLPIPNPSPIIKNAIHNLIIESFRLRDESNDLIDEAEKLLIKELELPPIEKLKARQFDKSAEFQNFAIKLSGLEGRFEATYHKPIIHAIIKHLKAHAAEVARVGDSRISKEIVFAGRFKRVYVEEGQGVVFLGGKELLQLDPKGDKFLSLQHHSNRIADELTIKENMVMVTCSGTIGKVALAPKHWDGWTANQHIMRVVPADDDMAGYAYAWLASDYGHTLITRYIYGAVIDEIDDNHMASVPIPLLKNQEIQNRINSLVLEANQKRYKAYLLEQEAIQSVNKQVIFAEK